MNDQEEIAKEIEDEIAKEIANNRIVEIKQGKLDEIRNNVINQKKLNIKYKRDIIDLQHSLLLREGEYAKKFAKEYVDKLEKNYKEILPFIEIVKNEEELFKSIRKIVKDSNKKILKDFMINSFQKVIQKYNASFLYRIDEFLTKNKIDDTLNKYVEKRVKDEMNKYKTEDVKKMVHFIVKDMTDNFNVQFSKEIINEMADMQTIQLQTMTKCLGKIKHRELLANKKYEEVLKIG